MTVCDLNIPMMKKHKTVVRFNSVRIHSQIAQLHLNKGGMFFQSFFYYNYKWGTYVKSTKNSIKKYERARVALSRASIVLLHVLFNAVAGRASLCETYV